MENANRFRGPHFLLKDSEQTGAAAGSNRGEEERLAPFWAENARNGTKSAENLTDFFKKVWKSTCIP
jgi:hypothetical protein